MEHPEPFVPGSLASFRPDKMGKATIFASERILVGLNCFEAYSSPGRPVSPSVAMVAPWYACACVTRRLRPGSPRSTWYW